MLVVSEEGRPVLKNENHSNFSSRIDKLSIVDESFRMHRNKKSKIVKVKDGMAATPSSSSLSLISLDVPESGQ